MLAAPVPVLTAVTGVAQAAISVRADGEILMLGAVADGLHAVAMLILAATDERL